MWQARPLLLDAIPVRSRLLLLSMLLLLSIRIVYAVRRVLLRDVWLWAVVELHDAAVSCLRCDVY